MDKILTGDYEGCYLAAFISPKLHDTEQYYAGIEEMQQFNSLLGKKVSVYMSFLSWERDGLMNNFPGEWCERVYQAGAVPHVTWEPWDFDRFCTKYTLDKIVIGRHDSFIRDFAHSVKEFGKPLFLRWAQEMNGFWYPWDGTHNFNEPERYIAAFRHIRSIFDDVGVKNVTWVWSPEVASDLVTEEPVYDYHNYYPGSDYVDWIGIDGLNFGPTRNASTYWKTFPELFGDVYADIAASYPGKPIMISGMGSTEVGGDKAEWVYDAFEHIRRMNKIKIVTFFNIEKEADWRVNSSENALKAYRESVGGPYFMEVHMRD